MHQLIQFVCDDVLEEVVSLHGSTDLLDMVFVGGQIKKDSGCWIKDLHVLDHYRVVDVWNSLVH